LLVGRKRGRAATHEMRRCDHGARAIRVT
jgi:hypothetical protein